VKVAPLPGLLRTEMVPLCLRTMSLAMLSPSPVPRPASRVVKKGSKIRSRSSSGIPCPVSATETQMVPFSRHDRTVILPLPSMASAAFARRFRKTRSICRGLQRVGGISPSSFRRVTRPFLSVPASRTAREMLSLMSSRRKPPSSGREKNFISPTMLRTRSIPSRDSRIRSSMSCSM